MKFYEIYNSKNPRLVWNNAEGWVKEDSTLFTEAEKDSFSTPLEGVWRPATSPTFKVGDEVSWMTVASSGRGFDFKSYEGVVSHVFDAGDFIEVKYAGRKRLVEISTVRPLRSRSFLTEALMGPAPSTGGWIDGTFTCGHAPWNRDAISRQAQEVKR
jgi:hypothetical protein